LLAAVIVLGLGALFLLFVLLFSQTVASHSGETLRELLHQPPPPPQKKKKKKKQHPPKKNNN